MSDDMNEQSLPYDRRAEVVAILARDETLLGRVYRYDLEGKSPSEMASAEGVANVGFVYNYRTQLRALVDDEIATSPTIALQVSRRVRKWLKTLGMSDDLRRDLEGLGERLTEKAGDLVARQQEDVSAVVASENAEAKGTPGIYVYTLPHYLLHPVDQDTGKTLLKVGHSSHDAYYRAGSAGRLTALPEEPILLRIYPVAESAATEREFHSWLRDADRLGTRTRSAGSEWFLTSTKFLDRIAKSLRLDIQVINDFEVGDE